MATKLLNTYSREISEVKREKLTLNDIEEYVNFVFDVVKKMSFRSAESKKNVQTLIDKGGFNLSLIPVDNYTLGACYCNPSNLETYGDLEMNENHTKIYTTYDLIATTQNTIIHEIAHAVVGARHGHDGQWQKCAERIAREVKAVSNYYGNLYFYSTSDSIIMGLHKYIVAYMSSDGDVYISNIYNNRTYFEDIAEKYNYTVLSINEYNMNTYSEVYNKAVETVIDVCTELGLTFSELNA